MHDQPDRLTNEIDTFSGTERFEQLGCDRLRQRHRWEPPDEYLPVHIENPADGALTKDDSPNPTPPPQGTLLEDAVSCRAWRLSRSRDWAVIWWPATLMVTVWRSQGPHQTLDGHVGPGLEVAGDGKRGGHDCEVRLW